MHLMYQLQDPELGGYRQQVGMTKKKDQENSSGDGQMVSKTAWW